MDSWKINDTSVILKDNFPRLYSFVLNDQMSAAQVFNLEDFSMILYLPLSISAYGELVELQTLMEANPLLDQKDAWCYAWGDKYLASKFYERIHSHISVPKVYHWLMEI
jgi:hypothetical protein